MRAKEQHAIGRFLGKPKMGLEHLAMYSFASGNLNEALLYYKQFIEYVMEDVRKVFPYLSENQKIGFYEAEMKYHLDFFYFFLFTF